MAQGFYTNEHFIDIARELISDKLFLSRFALYEHSVDVRKNLQTFAEIFEVRAKVYDTQLKEDRCFSIGIAMGDYDPMCVLSIDEQFYLRLKGHLVSLVADLTADDENRVDILL